RVDQARVVWRENDRRVPVKTKHFTRRRRGNNVRLQVCAAEAAKSLCRREGRELCLRVRSRRSARRRTRRGLCASLTTAAAATAAASWYAARSNAYAATGAQIKTLHRAALRLGIDGVVVSRIDLRVKTVATADA